MNILTRIKKFFIRLVVLVRKKLREIEGKLDTMQPHPVIGVFIMIAGVAIFIAGLAMMVLPGPGVLALALGIAFVVVGFKVLRGAYGPQRIERERAEKHDRLMKKRAERKAKKEQQENGA